MTELKTTGCLVCGADLVYSEEARSNNCEICGKSQESNSVCKNGHYICDSCHSFNASQVILNYCENSGSTDPVQMAVDLMKYSAIKMHGPEHHFLVPAILVAAHFNKKGDQELKVKKLAEALKRASIVPGGVCGTLGCCGAGVGAGIFISLITGATSLSKTEWKQSNAMTAQTLLKISESGGPRCCKRNTYLALETAMRFVREQKLGDLGDPLDVVCQHSGRNKECLFMDCKYFRPSALMKGNGSQNKEELKS